MPEVLISTINIELSNVPAATKCYITPFSALFMSL